MRDAIGYLSLLDDGNVKAFLHTIRVGEGTADPMGYRRHFGGTHFDSYAAHPNHVITAGLGHNRYSSSAAGAYQFLSKTWAECAAVLELRDFSPRNQDIAALFLIDRRRALDDVLAGRFEDAVRKCNREWASLPGSPYGQPTKTLAQALATYIDAGGLSEKPTQLPTPEHMSETSVQMSQEQPMPAPLIPILAAVLPSLIRSIPDFGKLFSSGSEVSERNVKAVEMAVGIVQEAVGARNAQEAAEIVASDPAQAQAAQEAVKARWHELTEVGGGVEAARKADAASIAQNGPWWQVFRSPSFIVALFLLPLVYMIVGAVVGLFGAPFSEDVRAAIANGIVGLILGGLIGYYYGQTTSRNRSQTTM
jgi:muramidase (phage lysozyme)